jgi:uncharacterized RDD family membrane protein YckC
VTAAHRIAGEWRRTFALLLDGLLALAAVAPLVWLISGGVRTSSNRILAIALLLSVYAVWAWMTSRFGGTPAKLLLGLRVVDSSGQFVDFSRASIRQCFYVAYTVIRGIRPPEDEAGRAFLTIASTALIGADLFYGFRNPARQTLHDRLAGTFVIQKPRRPAS